MRGVAATPSAELEISEVQEEEEESNAVTIVKMIKTGIYKMMIDYSYLGSLYLTFVGTYFIL